MKKIIDGKLYNTATAKQIASACSDLPQSDFGWWSEELYLTKNGAWFIAGQGGALSQWSQPYGSNGSCGSCGIKPLTESEAQQWLENSELDSGFDEVAILESHFKIESA